MKRYERLLNRRASATKRILERYSENFEAQPGENAKYLIGAMAPVDKASTAKLVQEGDRVEAQLKTRLQPKYSGIEFRRQGSVSNDTHIKYYSDIDLLTIIDKFITLEPPQVASPSYSGEPVDDLLELRKDCVGHLKSAYPAVTVDDTGSTSIAMRGGSLACEVDVVPANWYDTMAYAQGQGAHTRGIMVLNRDEKKRHKNYPFLFNHRINAHDVQNLGAPRALIRLLKSVKADYDEENPTTPANISSFDLCSVVYRMPFSVLIAPRNEPLKIVGNLLTWLDVILGKDEVRAGLKVIDDSRNIFDDAAKVRGLRVVRDDLAVVYYAAVMEAQHRQILTEAHLGG